MAFQKQSRVAFQNGGQAFFIALHHGYVIIASWVCDLIPCFLDQASQYGGERTRTCNETKNYFSNIELFFFFYFMPVVEMKEF